MLAILNATTAFNTMIIAYFWLKEDVTLKRAVDWFNNGIYWSCNFGKS